MGTVRPCRQCGELVLVVPATKRVRAEAEETGRLLDWGLRKDGTITLDLATRTFMMVKEQRSEQLFSSAFCAALVAHGVVCKGAQA